MLVGIFIEMNGGLHSVINDDRHTLGFCCKKGERWYGGGMGPAGLKEGCQPIDDDLEQIANMGAKYSRHTEDSFPNAQVGGFPNKPRYRK